MTENVAAGLIRALIENMKNAPEEWASFSMVLGFDSEKVNSTYGFTYDDDGVATAVSASPYEIRSPVRSYLDSYYAQSDALPLGLLVQFERAKGEYEMTFEDQDAGRWKVTPRNMIAIRDELRPKF